MELDCGRWTALVGQRFTWLGGGPIALERKLPLVGATRVAICKRMYALTASCAKAVIRCIVLAIRFPVTLAISSSCTQPARTLIRTMPPTANRG